MKIFEKPYDISAISFVTFIVIAQTVLLKNSIIVAGNVTTNVPYITKYRICYKILKSTNLLPISIYRNLFIEFILPINLPNKRLKETKRKILER